MDTPTTSERLSTLSPSRIDRLLACPLQIAFEQTTPGGGPFSRSPAALLGLAVHAAIEAILSRASPGLDQAWTRACDTLAQQGTDPRGLPGARRAKLRLRRRLPQLLAYINERSPAELLLERLLTSPDGTIVGQPDLLIVRDRPCIVDYKTGTVTTEEGPRPGYSRQLAIYAWLVASAFGVEDIEAGLFSLREGMVPVDVSAPVRARVVAETVAARENYNQQVPGRQPARPDETTCGRCPYVCSCDAAWRALETERVVRLGWGEAIRGRIGQGLVISSSGLAGVPLTAECGTVRGQAMIVDVPATAAQELQEDSEVTFVGLALRSLHPLTLVWRDGVSGVVVRREE